MQLLLLLLFLPLAYAISNVLPRCGGRECGNYTTTEIFDSKHKRVWSPVETQFCACETNMSCKTPAIGDTMMCLPLCKPDQDCADFNSTTKKWIDVPCVCPVVLTEKSRIVSTCEEEVNPKRKRCHPPPYLNCESTTNPNCWFKGQSFIHCKCPKNTICPLPTPEHPNSYCSS